MKRFYIFAIAFLLAGICSAQDLVILRDGNIIESQVTEISPTEIRYKRFSHLDGPTIVLPVSNVLSIRYKNGIVEIFDTTAKRDQGHIQQNLPQGGTSASQPILPQGGTSASQPSLPQERTSASQPFLPMIIQYAINQLPAIPIAGNNLKFEFDGETWIARINGENFLAGTIEYEDTDEGGILILKQTHIWPGTTGKAAGRVVSRIPGAAAVGGAIETAGNVASAAGAIEASGPIIVLEYTKGPPSSLRLISRSDQQDPTARTATLPADSYYQDFTAGQRWGTFFLNIMPGVGSFTVMHDLGAGIWQLILTALGTGISVGIGNPTPVIVGLSINLIINIARSAGYHKPQLQTASLIDPAAWKVAVLPGKDGIEQVALSYTLRF